MTDEREKDREKRRKDSVYYKKMKKSEKVKASGEKELTEKKK